MGRDGGQAEERLEYAVRRAPGRLGGNVLAPHTNSLLKPIVQLEEGMGEREGDRERGRDRFASRFRDAPREAAQRESEATFVQQLWILVHKSGLRCRVRRRIRP